MQQALRELRVQHNDLVKALKEINHKATTVFKNGAIDKQLQIDLMGNIARKALIEIGAVDKVI